MQQVTDLFKNRLTQVTLFHFGVLLFNWPLLSILIEDSLLASFPILFFAWFCMILLLALFGRSLGRKHSSSSEG